MNRIAESELIINDRGAVYHINTRPEEIAGTIITVGDPDRVDPDGRAPRVRPRDRGLLGRGLHDPRARGG